MSDIFRSVVVGIVCVAAGHTDKFRLRLSVGFVDMSALETSSGCMGGTYKNDRNAFQSGFIRDEVSELPERPGASFVSVLPSNPCLIKELLQVFQSNALGSAFGFLNEMLTDTVIDVFAEAGFSFADFPMSATRVFGMALLEMALMLLILLSFDFEGFS